MIRLLYQLLLIPAVLGIPFNVSFSFNCAPNKDEVYVEVQGTEHNWSSYGRGDVFKQFHEPGTHTGNFILNGRNGPDPESGNYLVFMRVKHNCGGYWKSDKTCEMLSMKCIPDQPCNVNFDFGDLRVWTPYSWLCKA